ncbi:MAG: HU family DNA-binding protein [Paludibacter sp.]|nr:HU family DNA-binding protein [Paludibacter sp.]
MSKDKISTQEIAELLSLKAGISKKAADDFIKQLFATIEDSLLTGEQVKVKNLGTFKLQWNEPRKSVNVQTGEEIILAGYNKVSFTPDAGLKDLVNEPYAHLEPVVLDENNEPEQEETPEPETDVLPDPLRIFTEQANEIKDILSEIQSLSAEHKATLNENVEEETEEATVADIVLNTETYDAEDLLNEDDEMVAEAENIQLQDDEKEEDEEEDILSVQPTEDLSKFEEAVPEIVIETPENKVTEPTETTDKHEEVSEKTPFELEKAPVTETVTEPQNTAMTETTESAAVIPPVKTRKRKPFFKRVWVWLLIVLLVLVGSAIAVYFSSSCISCWFEYKVLNQSQREQFQKVTNTLEDFGLNIKSIFIAEQPDTLVVSPDTIVAQRLPEVDTLPKVVAPEKTVSPIDSLDILLTKPRVYTEFIGSERIVEGSRLTRISERYYGTRDFWVYIYEANKERIKNPDMIPIGTLIKIPKVDARLLDAQNPKVMSKARELHDLYVGKK